MTRSNPPGDNNEGATAEESTEEGEGEQRRLRRQKWQEKQQLHDGDDGNHDVTAATAPPTTAPDANEEMEASSPEGDSGGGAISAVPPEPSEGGHRPPPPAGNTATNSTDGGPMTMTTAATIDADEGDIKVDADEDEEEEEGDDLFPRPPCSSIVPFEDAKAKLGNHLTTAAVVTNDDDGPATAQVVAQVAATAQVTAQVTAQATAQLGTRKRRLIATGLGNLGNTCFMNSTLQCLAHTPPLRSYFLSGSFEGDLNTDNPLGTGGELAREFARLLGQMWQIEDAAHGRNGSGGIIASSRIYSPGNGGSYDAALSPPAAATYPRSFKSTLGKHAAQFVGYDQHDSQELAIYLLDALHEDTNSVRKKPYVERPEQAEDEPDAAASARAWAVHLQRDDSRIVASFMGQVKSRLRCPTQGCGRESTTFDPSMYLSVPIPGSTDRTLGVTFVPTAPGAGIAELTVRLCKNSTAGTLRARVAALARECYGLGEGALREEDVVLAEIYTQKVWTYYDKEDYAIDGIKDVDVIYAYQLFPLGTVKEEYEAYEKQKREEEERKKQRQQQPQPEGSADVPGAGDRAPPSPPQLDAATRAKFDADPAKWEHKLSGHLTTPVMLYRLLNERRSSHEERLDLYRKLLKFVQKCKLCPDAAEAAGAGAGEEGTATSANKDAVSLGADNPADDDGGAGSNEDGDIAMDTSTVTSSEVTTGNGKERAQSEGQTNDEDSQTLEEVSYSARSFKGVRTPQDLAILEYCAAKFLAAICELKAGKDKTVKETIGENGMLVQIKIKKSDGTTNGEGGRYQNTSNGYGKSSSSSSQNWNIVGEPLVCRISPTLTVGGLRKMLGNRVSRGLMSEQSVGLDKMTIMRQVALSYENDSGRRNSCGHNIPALGSVTEEQLTANSTAIFAKSSDKKEQVEVASVVDPLGTIFLSWPPQFNDILDVDLLFSKEEFLTEQQKKEKQAAESNGGSDQISVMDCIAKYCEEEQLDESDAWYCSRCKAHVRAWKQFDLYRTPQILIIHLKRFHFSSTTHRRDKIDTLIDFPLVDLDLREVVKHWGSHEPIYDCYAVSNHFGGLGGGHYTAYAKLDDGTWCNFDDSRVSIVDKSEVVSSAAYCLYYKRKDVVVFDKDDENMKYDDDALMTNRVEEDSFPQGTAMRVSPSPCGIEDEGDSGGVLSNDHSQGNVDVMEVDHNGSSGSVASYATPTGPCPGIDDDIHVSPKFDVTFDLQ